MLDELKHGPEPVDRAHAADSEQAGRPQLDGFRAEAQRASNKGDVSHTVYFGQEALLAALLRLGDEVAALRLAIERR